MRRDDLYLVEMLEATDLVGQWMRDVGFDEWVADELRRSAVLQKLTVIGEAARAVAPDLVERHRKVPWRDIAAFRNRAVHEYFSIDWSRVWSIAQREVPALREQVLGVLQVEFPALARRYEERS